MDTLHVRSNAMSLRRYPERVGNASVVLFLASTTLAGLALTAFVFLAVLVFRWKIDTTLLFSVASKASGAGFIFLPVFLAVGVSLAMVCKRAQIPLRIKSRHSWKVVWIVCIVVFLHAFLTPSRYVHPDGNRWISTGRAGPWVVSEELARRYLWNEMEWSFLIIFSGSSLIALTARGIAQETRGPDNMFPSSRVANRL